jgi:hypothetical protein
MNWLWQFINDVALVAVGTAPVVLLAGAIAKPWFEKRIEQSIAHEYAKKLSDYDARIAQMQTDRQEEREIRLRAELVAELLATWVAAGPKDFERLNTLAFQAWLWLPKDLALELGSALAHEPGAPSVRTLIMKVRAHLLGPGNEYDEDEIVIFEIPGSGHDI